MGYNLLFIRVSTINKSCLFLFKNGTFLFIIGSFFHFVKYLTKKRFF